MLNFGAGAEERWRDELKLRGQWDAEEKSETVSSVENLSGSNDHSPYMCDGPKDDLAALAPVGPRAAVLNSAAV